MSQRLEPGMKAPDFNILNHDGRLISLSQYRGKKVWLAFYRYSSCPLCLDHFAEVVFRHQDIRAEDAEVIAVFESKKIDLHNNPCQKAHVFYPMIADPEKKLYKLYGAESSLLGLAHPSVLFKFAKALLNGYRQGKPDGDVGQLPAHFLIKADGTLDTVHYGKHIGDNLPWWKVARFMSQNRTEPSARVGADDPWGHFHYR